MAPDAEWVESLRGGAAGAAGRAPGPAVARSGRRADDMEQMANAGVVDLVGATVEAGAPVAEARNWWLGYLAQKANDADVEPAELADHAGPGRPS